MINISHSQLFDAAMKKAGAPGEFITVPGAGHSHVGRAHHESGPPTVTFTMSASRGHNDFQSEFFQRVHPAEQLLRLFEYLPDVDFFAKDTEGRFVAISAGMLRRVGARSEEDLLGVSDSTIHPPFVARMNSRSRSVEPAARSTARFTTCWTSSLGRPSCRRAHAR